jgi:hypothetical protein
VQTRHGRATVNGYVSCEASVSQTPAVENTIHEWVASTQGGPAVSFAPAVAVPAPIPVSVPVREIVPWAIFIGTLALVLLYFVGTEQGATSLVSGHYVHEFVHDGRHLLGFPCH